MRTIASIQNEIEALIKESYELIAEEQKCLATDQSEVSFNLQIPLADYQSIIQEFRRRHNSHNVLSWAAFPVTNILSFIDRHTPQIDKIFLQSVIDAKGESIYLVGYDKNGSIIVDNSLSPKIDAEIPCCKGR